jgi:hypothetical protein
MFPSHLEYFPLSSDGLEGFKRLTERLFERGRIYALDRMVLSPGAAGAVAAEPDERSPLVFVQSRDDMSCPGLCLEFARNGGGEARFDLNVRLATTFAYDSRNGLYVSSGVSILEAYTNRQTMRFSHALPG